MPKISIIIRTKNEERWITFCLKAVYEQTHKDIEVIVVDNGSTDYTVELAKKFPVKLITIDKFIPGKALNDGIRVSSGEYIVCLSAHCIPKDKYWLQNLLKNFDDSNVVGVYGRQEPLSYTPDVDKRDLIITFGLDRRVQKKDHFFHNANSMVRRDIWNKIPFDEEATNIEDRIWGKAVVDAGYQLVYEPEASVFHHHGIHQGGKPERAKGVVRIIEGLQEDLVSKKLPNALDPSNLNVVALLPLRGKVIELGTQNLLKRAIMYLKRFDLVNKVVVLGDDFTLASEIESWGAVFIERPQSLSSSAHSVEHILQFGVEQLAKQSITPDLVLYLNYQFPFHPKNLVDVLVKDLLSKGLDTVVPVLSDYSPFWIEEEGNLKRVDAGLMAREKKVPALRGLTGLGTVTLPSLLRAGSLFGEKIGVVKVNNQRYGVRVSGESDNFDTQVATHFIEIFN